MLIDMLTPLTYLTVWAAATASSTDLLSFFAQYGPLGVITALLIWFARGAHQRERDRADRLEEENKVLIANQRERERADRMEEDNKRLNAIVLDRVIPTLTEATRAAEQSAEVLRDFYRDRPGEQRPPKGRTP
jgi:hypothetical protein